MNMSIGELDLRIRKSLLDHSCSLKLATLVLTLHDLADEYAEVNPSRSCAYQFAHDWLVSALNVQD